MSDPFKQFNDQSNEFLNKMISTFPNEHKLKTYKAMFDLCRKSNSRKPVEMFLENLEPFGLQIITRDENFFKNDQYVQNVQSLSGKMGLVEHWQGLPFETKLSIWNYMQVLYILAMRSLGKMDDLKKILKDAGQDQSKVKP